jgi:ABC-2 type transport system permease protein
MSAHAATAGLLLRHELRLQWRMLGNKKIGAGLTVGIAFLFMHAVALPVAFILPYIPTPPRVALLAGVSLMLATVLLTMISTTLVAAVKAIHTRGDFDLVLSSPVPPRSVILVRSASIALSHFAIAALLVTPFVNMAALFGYPRFLAAYPVLMILTLLAASVGLLMVQGLVRVLGTHRTRLVTQVIAAVVAFVAVVLAQIPNLTSNEAAGSAYTWFVTVSERLPGEASALWWPARAAVGEPLALTVALLLSIALFALTTRGLAQRFVDSAAAAAGGGATPRAKAQPQAKATRRFRGGPVAVLRHKEWRLLARDPWLIAQVGQQMVLLLPLVFLMWKGHSAAIPALWLTAVLIAASLAGNLAWLTMSAEDAPDLIATAPVSRPQVLRAKLEAALMPVAALLAPAIMVAAFVNLWLAVTLLVCCTGAALSCATVHVRMPAPGKRSEFNQRGKSRPMAIFVEMMVGLAWMLIAALMLWHPLGALLPLLVALAAVAVIIAG